MLGTFMAADEPREQYEIVPGSLEDIQTCRKFFKVYKEYPRKYNGIPQEKRRLALALS